MWENHGTLDMGTQRGWLSYSRLVIAPIDRDGEMVLIDRAEIHSIFERRFVILRSFMFEVIFIIPYHIKPSQLRYLDSHLLMDL